ncbi:MAG: zinc-dependent peptidase [Candidatus Eremiobacteraeota bacterium]|nr:zinc-dependent peptidase [Candidatus Eremiobacteraeota bacterium]MCW5867523.1 zinc-dependent peptidase [Candidatus Eremiobacteraeota bacterium]
MIRPLSPLSRAAPFLPARKAAPQTVEQPPIDEVTLSSRPAQQRIAPKILLGALTAVSGLAGLAGSAAVIIHGAQKTAADTLKDMGAGDPQLQKNLAAVDLKILHLAQKEGVTFQLVKPGDDLLQTGALQPRPDSYVHDQLPQIQAFAAQLRDQPLDTVLDRLEAEQLPVKLFTIPTPGDLPFDPNLAQFSQMPQSIHGMALCHGAKTPEQIKEFTDLVKAINGETYSRAVQEAADRMTGFKRMGMNLTQQPFNEAEFRQNLINNQERLPLNHREINLLVPDLYYTSAGKLDNHDRASLESWSGQRDAKGELSTTGKINGDQNSIRGEYFKNKRILVRQTEVSKRAPIHELGHAMDDLLQQKDPEFYQSWKAAVQKNYDHMMQNLYGPEGGTEPITHYAETNVGEYIAEGFAHYHLAPDEFKAKDSKFYESIERFVIRLKQLEQPAAGPQTLGEYVTSLFKG